MKKEQPIEEKGPPWRLTEFFPDLSTPQLDLFAQYHRELLKFNQAINLVSSHTLSQSDVVHFADSILAGRAILKATPSSTIYDIGSGNGFPGIVVAILEPSRKLVLVDRDSRKAEFLKHVATTLKLSNIEIQVKSVEQLPDNSIQCAITRGFASITKCLMVARKLMGPGATFFHLKGDNWATELAEIPSQLCSLWEPSLLCQYDLPIKKQSMAVILTKRI